MTMSDAELNALVGELVETEENAYSADYPMVAQTAAAAAKAILALRAERDALRHDIERHVAIAAEECARAERAEADAARLRPALGNAIRMLEEEYGAVDPDHLYWATEQIKEMKDVYAAIAAEKESHS